MNNLFLIDCPGVVYPKGATPTDMVLKGVVRLLKYYQDTYFKSSATYDILVILLLLLDLDVINIR